MFAPPKLSRSVIGSGGNLKEGLGESTTTGSGLTPTPFWPALFFGWMRAGGMREGRTPLGSEEADAIERA